ncbi:hypothetical protein [Caldalkalibacillus salinus]|uniref:hypothetical protein n=1 Tax=Caldalkalibacillus salinus TaxID=2803787 RepID=UPI001920E1C6|nr:hypothetical protein [Caldalkalibacillus salinus]
MEPVWMNSYNCVFDRSFEQYVDDLPQPEAMFENLQQRKHMFCWLYTPIVEEVLIGPGETTKMELVGAVYSKENGAPVESARFYRYTNTGEKDFIMMTEDGTPSEGLSFEEMIDSGSDLNMIQRDL